MVLCHSSSHFKSLKTLLSEKDRCKPPPTADGEGEVCSFPVLSELFGKVNLLMESQKQNRKRIHLPLLSLKRSDPLPFLGEPAMASALAYWICKGFSYGPCSIMAHEKTSHDIQGKSLQQNFSCSAREVWYVLIKWKRHSDGAGEIPVMMLGGRKKSAFFFLLYIIFLFTSDKWKYPLCFTLYPLFPYGNNGQHKFFLHFPRQKSSFNVQVIQKCSQT